MRDISKNRRLLGRIGVLTAIGVILPMTATMVPAIADDTEAASPKNHKKIVRIITIKDGKRIDVSGNDDGAVKRIERDGKTYIFHTDKTLSPEETEKMIAAAEASRIEADEIAVSAEQAKGEAEVTRQSADAAEAEAKRTVIRVRRSDAESIAMALDGSTAAAMIPDIDISELREGCDKEGATTTNVEGSDGKSKARVRIVMCGKGQAKMARAAAVEGLKEALKEIKAEDDIPASVRKEVLDSLKAEIRKLEKQNAEETSSGT